MNYELANNVLGNAHLRAFFRARFERVGPMTGISDNELVLMGEPV